MSRRIAARLRHSLLGSLALVPRPIDLARGQEVARHLGATEFIVGTMIEWPRGITHSPSW